MTDSPRMQGLRHRMVEALRQKGIYSDAVLDALEAIPRHLFMPPGLEHLAYEDQALPITCGQTISRPSTVALQSHCLNITPGMKVMEIGTGSGYQTAVLCHLGAKVYTIERQRGLFLRTQRLFAQMNIRPMRAILGDGYKGATWKDYAPFDRIIITCGAPEIPQPLIDQLKVGGHMVIPLDNEMTLYRQTDGEPQILRLGACHFVPMLKQTT